MRRCVYRAAIRRALCLPPAPLDGRLAREAGGDTDFPSARPGSACTVSEAAIVPAPRDAAAADLISAQQRFRR